MLRELRSSVSLFVLLFLMTGILYPWVTRILGHALFPFQAEGSILIVDHNVIGSSLIGQTFTGETYFHGRPSLAGTGYDAENSGASNASPASQDWFKSVADRVTDVRHMTSAMEIPVDLVTASGSGLDPDISVASALLQAPHVAQYRNLNRFNVEALVMQSITPRTFGVLGEPRVNVLSINMALDRLSSVPNKASP